MILQPVNRGDSAVWQFRAETESDTHSIVIYQCPRAVVYYPTSRVTAQSRPHGGHGHTWFEAVVDGEWADLSGHVPYRSPVDAFQAAISRLGDQRGELRQTHGDTYIAILDFFFEYDPWGINHVTEYYRAALDLFNERSTLTSVQDVRSFVNMDILIPHMMHLGTYDREAMAQRLWAIIHKERKTS